MWGSRQVECSNLGYKNLSIHITGYTDSEDLGYAHRAYSLLGFHSLSLNLEGEDLESFIECAGELWSNMGLDEDFYPGMDTSDTDLIIHFFHWALKQPKTINIEIEINHFFWLFHDLVHAEEDTVGCILNGVPGQRELEAFEEAFKLAEEYGFLEYAKLTEAEAEELTMVFNERFAKGYRAQCPPIQVSFFSKYIKESEVLE